MPLVQDRSISANKLVNVINVSLFYKIKATARFALKINIISIA